MKFVIDFLDVCLEKSSSLYSHNSAAREPLINQVLAVVKRPDWRRTVANRTELLMPLPLQAHLHAAIDGKAGVGPTVLQ